MPDIHHLTPDQVPANLRGSYSGRKFAAVIATEVTIPADAGLWDNGCRDTYHFIRLEDGVTLPAADHQASPFGAARSDKTVKLQPGLALVVASMVHGKDQGRTFHLHPENAALLIEGPSPTLTDDEAEVLNIVACVMSKYRRSEATHNGIDEARYDQAVSTLISHGLLTKSGSITTRGKNVRQRNLANKAS